jgi:hypothetical protein
MLGCITDRVPLKDEERVDTLMFCVWNVCQVGYSRTYESNQKCNDRRLNCNYVYENAVTCSFVSSYAFQVMLNCFCGYSTVDIRGRALEVLLEY